MTVRTADRDCGLEQLDLELVKVRYNRMFRIRIEKRLKEPDLRSET